MGVGGRVVGELAGTAAWRRQCRVSGLLVQTRVSAREGWCIRDDREVPQ